MASFNLEDYETVEVRLRKLYAEYPDARIITHNLTTLQDRQVSTWVVKAELYLNAEDQRAGLVKATGLAFEIDSNRGPNQTSALENCETSSIGRCLANAGWSGNKRASRSEMEKVARGIAPAAPIAQLDPEARKAVVSRISAADSKDALRAIWQEFAPFLDQSWINELEESVSLKALIMARQAEVK